MWVKIRTAGGGAPSGLWIAPFVVLFFGATPVHAAAPVIDDLSASVGVVAPGGTVTVAVQAHDPDCPDTCASGCGQTIRADLTRWTTTAGSVVASDNGTTGSPYAASAIWQAPATEGTYSITVSLSDSGTFLCGGRATTTGSLDVLVSTASNTAPVVTSVTASPGRVYPGQQVLLSCSATDADDDPVAFDWATDLGAVTPDASSPGMSQAVLETPRPGIATVVCSARDPAGAADSASVQVAVTDAVAERTLAKGLSAPHRLAIDDFGDVYVVDRSRAGIQVVNLFSGEPVYRLDLPGVTSVAVDWGGDLVIGAVDGARVIDRTGRPLLALEVEPGVGPVADVAVDPVRQRYVTLHRTSGRVIVYDATGARQAAFGTVGDGAGELRSPGGVAVAPGGEIVVADGGHGTVHVFEPLTGALVRSFGGLGAGAGTFVRLDDVAVGSDGVIWASDSFQDWVQTFDPDGTLREVFGTYGSGLGELKTAAGLGISDGLARLVAASVNTGSVQVFRTDGAPGVEPAPALSYTPSSLSFGARPVGATSAPRTVSLRNQGTAPLGIRSLATRGDFAVAGGCPDFLDPGAACTVAVTFTPTGVGARTGALLLDTSDGAPDGGPVTVSLDGSGVVTGVVVATPHELRFSDQPVGTTSEGYEVFLSNPGTTPATLVTVGVSGPYAQTNDCPRMLAAGGRCTVRVYFAPQAKGDYLTGTLTVESDTGSEHVPLTGQGTALEISPVPGSVDFGTRRLTGPPTRRTLVVSNTGTDLVEIRTVGVAGEAAGAFAVEEDDCTGSLLWLNEECTVTVAFVPTQAGAAGGELQVTSNAPSARVALRGFGVDASVTAIPTLSEWGLLALSLLLALGGAIALGRKG